MKIEKIYEILESYMKENPEVKDQELEVILSENSIGPSAATPVVCVYPGFDWDNGRMLLTTEEKICREDHIKDLVTQNKRAYKIISYTDREGNNRSSAEHRIGRIVSDPVVDKKHGYARMFYLYEKDGTLMRFGKFLKTSPVSQIIKSYNNKNEEITIITENSFILLKETSCPL